MRQEKRGGPRKEEVPVDRGELWPVPRVSWKPKGHLSRFQEHSTKGGRVLWNILCDVVKWIEVARSRSNLVGEKLELLYNTSPPNAG